MHHCPQAARSRLPARQCICAGEEKADSYWFIKITKNHSYTGGGQEKIKANLFSLCINIFYICRMPNEREKITEAALYDKLFREISPIF